MPMPPRPIEPPARPHTPTLSRSARGVEALRIASLRVADLEAQLELANREVKRLEEVELPAAFTEDGISELQLPDGQRAKREVMIQGSLPSEDEHPVERENALTWLAENGYPDVIRCVVAADFGQDNRQAALELYERMRSSNIAHITKKESVHASTLKALIRQRLIHANPPLPTPIEELGCTIIRRIRLTTPPRARAADTAQAQRPTPSAPIEPEDI